METLRAIYPGQEGEMEISQEYSLPTCEVLVISEQSLERNRKDELGQSALSGIASDVAKLDSLVGTISGQVITLASATNEILDFLNAQKLDFESALRDYDRACEQGDATNACIASRIIRKSVHCQLALHPKAVIVDIKDAETVLKRGLERLRQSNEFVPEEYTVNIRARLLMMETIRKCLEAGRTDPIEFVRSYAEIAKNGYLKHFERTENARKNTARLIIGSDEI